MFAVTSPKKEQIHWLLFYGTDYHSHLTTGYGGMAIRGDTLITRIHSLENSQFKTEAAKDLHLFNGTGNCAIGAIGNQPQPLNIVPVDSNLGIFSICINGYVANAEALAIELNEEGTGFNYDIIDNEKVINQAKLVGRLISTKSNFVEGINYAFDKVYGSVSVLILNCHGIYAARSKHGHTALTLGRKEEAWVIASETNSFPNLSIQQIRQLEPGEIILMTEMGVETKFTGRAQCQFCPFYLVYTGSPASEYYGQSAENYREEMGALLARKDITAGFVPDYVCGVADSGTTYAHGYANGSIDIGFPVKHIRPIIKYTPGYSRSYTPQKQLDRDLVARNKQLPPKDKWQKLQGKDIVFTEDSIVRGTQLMQLLARLQKIVCTTWGFEPARIHIRVGSPILGWPCPYLGTTKSPNEMAARKAVARLRQIPVEAVTDEILCLYLEHDSDSYNELVRAIAFDLGAASIVYPTLEEMVSITGLPKKDLCTYCWTGRGV